MSGTVRILGTGVRVQVHPDPESALLEREAHLTPEERAELAARRAGEAVFVQVASFVEFEDGSGGAQRWEGTPQGPYALPFGRSASSALLALVEDVDDPLLGDLGLGGLSVSRFGFHAAPRRIDVDPELASRLILD